MKINKNMQLLVLSLAKGLNNISIPNDGNILDIELNIKMDTASVKLNVTEYLEEFKL